jgi:hypothetical protein
MLNTSEQDSRFRTQINIMTAFYSVCTLTDWVNYWVSRYEYAKDAHTFECCDDHFLIVDSTLGAGLLLIYSVVMLTYSYTMIHVFYILPAR